MTPEASMMDRVLAEGLADRVITTGVLGEIFLLADGVKLGEPTERFIAERDLDRFVDVAASLLADHPQRIALPLDVATAVDGRRREIAVSNLPADALILDVGTETITAFERDIAAAGTVFVNGPTGAYEQPGADLGTRRLLASVAAASGRTVIGGGDTVASAARFVDPGAIDFVSTGGGALIRFVSGQALPLLEAFRRRPSSPPADQDARQ